MDCGQCLWVLILTAALEEVKLDQVLVTYLIIVTAAELLGLSDMADQLAGLMAALAGMVAVEDAMEAEADRVTASVLITSIKLAVAMVTAT